VPIIFHKYVKPQLAKNVPKQLALIRIDVWLENGFGKASYLKVSLLM